MSNSQQEPPLNSKDEILEQRWLTARTMLQAAKSNVKITKCRQTGLYPLSNTQKRFWVLECFQDNGATYNVPFVMNITGPITPEIIKLTCNTMLKRHEILRSVIQLIDNVPFLRVLPFTEHLLKFSSAYDISEKEVLSEIGAEIHNRIDLNNGPTVYFKLFFISSNCKMLLICSHAIFIDRSSIALFVKEFSELLKDSTNENDPPFNYWDYTQWQNSIQKSIDFRNKIDWWKKYLDGAPESLMLLTDYHRSRIENHKGDKYPIQINSDLTLQIDSFCRNSGITRHTLITAVYAYLLGLLSHQNEIVFGIPVTLRNRKELLPVIGPFINSLPIRLKISKDLTIKQFIISVTNLIQDALKYQDVPFDLIIKELNVKRDLAKSPIFQTMFIYQNIPLSSINTGADIIHTFIPKTNTSIVDITFCIEEMPDHLSGYIEYATSLFKMETIEQYYYHFTSLLRIFVHQHDCYLKNITLPSKFIPQSNSKYHQYSDWRSIPAYFQEQVEKTPDSIAIVFETESIFYGVLHSRANMISEMLKKEEIKPGTVVGIVLPPSPALIVAELGILKNGCTVAVVNFTDPHVRTMKMLNEANVKTILTTTQRSKEFHAFTVFSITPFGDSIVKSHACNVDSVPNIDAAYCVFTSGSTGIPKCVLLSAESINNHTFALIKEFNITEDDRIALSLNPSFVASIWQIWAPLFSGATLFIYEQMNDPRLLLSKVSEDKITIIEFTPSIFDSFLRAGLVNTSSLESVRFFILTGEQVSQTLVRKYYELSKVPLINLYGQTECCDDTLCYHIPSDFSGIRIPAGKAIDNTVSYIVDDYLNILPPLIPGELCTEGVCLALGYINQHHSRPASLTVTINGRHVYKTGDLARMLPDGNIEILGRIDNQIKMHGNRIELGEIETVVNSCFNIKHSIARYFEKTDNSPEGIALYLVAKSKITHDEIQKHLRSTIPLYMVPKWIIYIDELPINTNGKIDKNSLPFPTFMQQESTENTQPEDLDEQKIQNIWRIILKIENVNVTDDFFLIGGDSLQAVALMAELEREFFISLSISILFEYPTIRSLAKVIKSNYQNKYNTIVTMHDNPNSNANLFCIHALEGDVLHYRNLGTFLNPAISLFGVYSPDQIFSSKITIPEMAKVYLNDILRIQKGGPYHFLGYCMGGLISYEIARLLAESGRDVSFVGIIDTEPPFVGSHLNYCQQRIKTFLGETHQRQWIALLRKFKKFFRSQSKTEKDFSDRIHAIRVYRPVKTSLQLDILISSEVYNSQGKEFFKPWSELVNNTINYRVIPDTQHLDLLSEKNVQKIVKIIEERIL
jgi:amino acid adenylation domain-containing protein